MKKFLVIATATVSVMALTADANAWSRKNTVTGPGGNTVTHQSKGHCDNASCSRSGRITGPAGNSVTYGGSTSCHDGVCTRKGKITGPRGRTFKFRSTFAD
jgi:hypothetical protein